MESIRERPNLHRKAHDRSNFTIYIAGLCITELKDGSWRTVFLENNPTKKRLNGHKLNAWLYERVRFRTIATREVRFADHEDNSRFVSIATEKQGSATGFFYPDDNVVGGKDNRNVEWLGDFGSSELYGTKIRARSKADFPLTHLKINGGILYSARFIQYCEGVPDIYQFTKKDSRITQRKLAQWLAIDWIVEPGAEVKIKSGPNESNTPNSDSIVVEGGKNYELFLESLCEACSEDVDFHYFYKDHGGILLEEEIQLESVSTPQCHTINRIACNAMLARGIAWVDE